MMAKPILKLYKEAKLDKEFRQDLKNAGEESYKPHCLWDSTMKCLYATCYMGYKVARGTYADSDYK